MKVQCPYCLRRYTIGINGTKYGCDECMKVLITVLPIPQPDDKKATEKEGKA